jgi:hypothetical protein
VYGTYACRGACACSVQGIHALQGLVVIKVCNYSADDGCNCLVHGRRFYLYHVCAYRASVVAEGSRLFPVTRPDLSSELPVCNLLSRLSVQQTSSRNMLSKVLSCLKAQPAARLVGDSCGLLLSTPAGPWSSCWPTDKLHHTLCYCSLSKHATLQDRCPGGWRHHMYPNFRPLLISSS